MNNESNMTGKEKRFCEEYVIDYNATRAAKAAGYSQKTAKEIGCENLTKPHIKDHIDLIRSNLQELANISALLTITELKKIAFSNIARFRDDWMQLKCFDGIMEDEKACISEITAITKTNKAGDVTEIVKLRLYDKLEAIEKINKMLGYNAPEKHEIDGISFNITTTNEGKEAIDSL